MRTGPDDRVVAPLAAAVVEVADAVARLAALLDQGTAWHSTDRHVLDAVAPLARVRAALDETHLRLVREVDRRGVAEASPVATTPEGFLRTTCLLGATAARRDVAAARATAPGAVLERLGPALAEGRCSRPALDRAVQCLDRIPEHLLERPGCADEVGGYLLLACTGATPVDVARASRDLLASLAPDPDDRADERAFGRRFFDLTTDATGMTVGHLQLDPVAGAALRVALQRWSAPGASGAAPAPDGDVAGHDGHGPAPGTTTTPAPVGADGERDTRSPRQRRADALAMLVETALAVQVPRRGERPRVVVLVTPDQLTGGGTGLPRVEGGAPLSSRAARRLACDAVLQRLVESSAEGPLALGRTQRLASVTQRRALAARDGGCVVPGCGAGPDLCDAHHVVHWVDGGPTDKANMVLLCPGHHTAVHAGTWQVTMDAHQQVQVVPPRWVDPRRRPVPAWQQRVRRLLADVERIARGAGEERRAEGRSDKPPADRPPRPSADGAPDEPPPGPPPEPLAADIRGGGIVDPLGEVFSTRRHASRARTCDDGPVPLVDDALLEALGVPVEPRTSAAPAHHGSRSP